MKGERGADTSAKFRLELIAGPEDQTVAPVTKDYFDLTQNPAEAIVYLVRKVQGPQDFELKLTTSVYEGSRVITVLASHVRVHVSQYEF